MHRFYHAAFAPKRWNGTETALGLCYGDCRFLLNANCGEKNVESGAKREGRSGFRKQDIFFFFFFWPNVQNKTFITGLTVNVLTQYGLKCSTYTLLVKLTTVFKTSTDLVP